jgi:hypothetical protein
MSTLELVNAAISGDRDQAISNFNSILASKVSDALEIKKVELATNLLTPQEEQNDTTENSIDVDGTDGTELLSEPEPQSTETEQN